MIRWPPRVISGSVRIMAADIAAVSETLAAFTADNPNSRERLPLVVGGSIAANSAYRQQLEAAVSELAYVRPLQVLGDAAQTYADWPCTTCAPPRANAALSPGALIPSTRSCGCSNRLASSVRSQHDRVVSM